MTSNHSLLSQEQKLYPRIYHQISLLSVLVVH